MKKSHIRLLATTNKENDKKGALFNQITRVILLIVEKQLPHQFC
jgi:hypothetical protein